MKTAQERVPAMKPMEEKTSCDHCKKEDCEQCVKEGNKTFCCTYCCEDYKKRQAEKSKEPVNVCKYC